jgi:L,D-transpeptidase YbiS
MPEAKIFVSLSEQRLYLLSGSMVVAVYGCSTSAKGSGTEEGSNKTPKGRFRVAEMGGAGTPLRAVFRSRLPTGELGAEEDPEDLVTTRYLWLDGLDPDNANTRARYIYIHGTNHEREIGTPGGHGCVRLRNGDVAELYELVVVGTQVLIAN